MNILILNGSPHPNGTTAQLRAAFEAGALSLPNSNYIEEARKIRRLSFIVPSHKTYEAVLQN